MKEQIEYINYDSDTLLGGLVQNDRSDYYLGGLARNDRGDYFAYESDRRHLLLMWGVTQDFSTSFSLFQEKYQDAPALNSRAESTLVAPKIPHFNEMQNNFT